MKKSKKPIQFLEYRGFTIKFRLLGELDKKKSRIDKKLFKADWIKAKEEMFIRDEGKCVFCKKEVSKDHYQTCHVIPRFFKESHNDVNNLLLGCYKCHKGPSYSAHQHPLWFCNFLRENRPQQYFYLMAILLKDIENRVV